MYERMLDDADLPGANGSAVGSVRRIDRRRRLARCAACARCRRLAPRGAMFYTILRALPGGENFKVIVGVVAICGVGTAGLLHKKGRGYDSMADKRAAQQAEIDAAQREAQVKAPVSSLLVGREK